MNDNPTGYILFGLVIIYLVLFHIPRNGGVDEYQRNVKSIAHAYPVYVSDLCPNRSGLEDVKNSYLKTIPDKDVSHKKWAIDNFDTIFIDTCLENEKKLVDK